MRARQQKKFRDYSQASDKVKDTYRLMQENQTLSFVHQLKNNYGSEKGYRDQDGRKIRVPFEDIPAVLDKIVDDSDPDIGLPQIYHAFQTGEALKAYLDPEHPSQLRKDIKVKHLFSDKEWQQLPIRFKLKFSGYLHELYPHITDWSWLPLVGFLHDSGKVLADKQWGALPQWAVVGDTFPVGAPFSKANVFAEYGFFKNNPDLNLPNNQLFNFGKYKRHCGFEQVDMSWGHDEYLYSVLHRSPHDLPPEALYIIRFHSFYPWHTPSTGEQGYKQLANDNDWMRLPLLKAFQKSDLYSKKDEKLDQAQLQQYYLDLLHRYFPERENKPAKIKW